MLSELKGDGGQADNVTLNEWISDRERFDFLIVLQVF